MKVRRAVLITAVSIAALIAAYAAAGTWLAPKLLRERLPQYVERELGHKLELGALRIHPFHLSAEVEGVRLGARDGAPLASFARLRVDLEFDSLWRRAWHFKEVTLIEPRVDLALDGEGRLNWSALLDALPKGKGEGGPPPQLVIDQIALRQGALAYADRSREASADLLVQPIEIDLLQLSTASGKRASSSIKAQLKGGGSLDWQGGLTLEPLALDGRLTLDALPAATAWRFADPTAKPPPGTLRAATKVSFRGDPRSLALEELTAKLEAFSIELAEGAGLSLGTLALAPSRFRVFAREGELGPLQLDSLRYAAPANGLDAKLARVETGPVTLQLDAQAIRVAQVALEGATLEAALEQGGKPASVALERVELGQIDIALEQPKVSLASAVLAGLRAEAPPDARGGRARTQLDKLETGALHAELGPPEERVVTLERMLLTAISGETAPDAQGARGTAQLDRVETGALRVVLGAAERQALSLERAVLTALRAETAPDAQGARGTAQLDRVETGALRIAFGMAERQALSLERAVLTALRGETPPGAGGRRGRVRLDRLEALTLRVAPGERALSLERVVLAAPHYEDSLDQRGTLNVVRLAEQVAPAKAPAPVKPPATPWRVELGALQVGGGSLRLEDHRISPAGRIDLGDIKLSATRLVLPEGKPAEITASLTLKPGAKLAARGRLALEPFAADLRVEADGIALASAQPWLAPFMRPQVASGTLSTSGRLRAAAAPPKDGAQIAYDGALSIAGLKLLEGASGDEFASLRALQVEALKLSIAPNRLEIDELALLEPSGKLVITEDGSTNLANAFGPQGEPAAAPKKAAATSEPEFAVNRVTVDNAKLAFSDRTLKPLFTTRIHELSGVISGLSSDRGAAARAELDGRVDEFGSARIRGTIDVRAPGTLTDMTLQFRNLALETLNPYTAKFAGRRIESGRLAADLRYRVRDDKLKGENKLVIERLKLGERVEDPDAPNLPLDLAVALLTDLDGRMRIGIPVEGDLSNPKFDTGALIAKALGNAIGKVATAPFQMLAALLRRDVEELDHIDFDPGSAKLPPPEREKIASLAKALAERPQIALAVHGQFALKADAEALRALSVRRALAQRMGIPLRPDEDPGPPGLSDPRTAKAAEALFAERFGDTALKEIKPSALGADTPADPRALARARVNAMIEKLTAQAPLAEGMLEKLAQARAEAARAALVQAGADPSRIALAKPELTEASADADAVPTRLSIEVR